jgi:biotin carboxylase
VPRYARAQGTDAVREAAARIGYPLVIKPIAGAGTAHTHGVRDAAELEAVLARVGHVDELSVEEYIEGEEFTYDAVAIEGKPVFESVAQYHPKPLESRNNEWISPAQIVFRDPYQPALRPGIELGRAVLQALGMDTGFVHMEWFKKPDGEAVFGEIAARNGGAKLVDQMNFANDFDVYREWARAVCWHSFEDEPRRRYHVAVVFKRAMGQGRITRIEGLEALRAFCGRGLVLEHLLPIGHARRNWKSTLLSDGYVLMRDPEYQRCTDMMTFAVNNLRMYAQ